MNSRAAQEILDIIMLDDFVARKKSLDDWTRRWVTTMHVEFTHDGTCPKPQQPKLYRMAQGELLRQILNGLMEDQVKVLAWGRLAEDPNSLVCEMHCIMQEPRDINEGADALQRMLDMAKGGGK